MNEKKAFRPIPGARPTGRLQITPLASNRSQHQYRFATNTAPASIPDAAAICGLTKIMYAMVAKVVTPPTNSFFTLLPCALILKSFSKIPLFASWLSISVYSHSCQQVLLCCDPFIEYSEISILSFKVFPSRYFFSYQFLTICFLVINL